MDFFLMQARKDRKDLYNYKKMMAEYDQLEAETLPKETRKKINEKTYQIFFNGFGCGLFLSMIVFVAIITIFY